MSGVGGKLKKLELGHNLSITGMSVKCKYSDDLTPLEHVRNSTATNPFEQIPKTYEPRLVHWTNMNMKGMSAKESNITKEANRKKALPAPTAYALH